MKYESLSKSTLKSSQEKAIRKKIIEDCPAVEEVLELLWPKKAGLLVAKVKPHTTIYFIKDLPVFIQVDKFPITPHMRVYLECNSFI